jgi:hypothetical protein
MSLGGLLCVHARESLGMPPEWEVYAMECGPEERLIARQEPLYYKVKGAVAPFKTRGPNARKCRAWDKRDKATDKTFVCSPAEHEAWSQAWSERTGLCTECAGAAQVLQSWSATDGTTYRPCNKCNATGKAATRQEAGK